MMKKINLLLAALLFVTVTVSVNAQSIDAKEIIKKAKAGKDITYQNATIKGVLDFTPYEEKKDDLPGRSWFSTSSNTIKNEISGKITFINCTFEDDVLAYLHDDDTEYTFVSNFEEDVIFKNCAFKEGVAFKYSTFSGIVDFSGSEIKEEANFKYAEFEKEADFAKLNFKELANFKYAEFEEMVTFSGSTFNSEANFKYTEIDNGVNFSNTIFEDFLNLKYTKLNGAVNLKNFQINGDMDTKYTEVNGKSFTSYLVNNR
ncbi:hypothetical protein C9994_05100 [Marivirga lumbricoides]|uniref:Pentapeptide repeat-containing protein n=1 Tax=Marivirga lumbricoides TaxID=1046115 RepID=A0A2T4DT07_9BACT|nr:hypothetical protein C9994_05100 [Marivirga lumbricoides]